MCWVFVFKGRRYENSDIFYFFPDISLPIPTGLAGWLAARQAAGCLAVA